MNTRALRALALRRAGFKLTYIANEFGITNEWARQLTVRGLELERLANSTDPWDDLPLRVRNALRAAGCEPTPAGLVQLLAKVDWRRIPGIGVKAFAELQAWLERHGQEAVP